MKFNIQTLLILVIFALLFLTIPGVIIKAFNFSSKIDFTKLDSKQQIETLENMAQSKGAVKTWKYLVETYKGQAGSSGTIHDLAHLTGILLYNQLGFAGLKECTPDFAFGCYHGFLDVAFQDNLERLTEAEEGCLLVGSSASGPFASCIHGIGHGIASFYGVSDLNDSLLVCDNLSQGSNYCYDGVFMEFARGTESNFYMMEKPLYPCDQVDREYTFSCGRNQPTVLMQRFNYTFEHVITTCLNSLEKSFKEGCFDALGFIAAQNHSNPDLIIGDCDKIGVSEFRNRCMVAAAGELVFQNVNGWQENAPKVCSSLDGGNKNYCNEHIEGLVLDYSR